MRTSLHFCTRLIIFFELFQQLWMNVRSCFITRFPCIAERCVAGEPFQKHTA